MVNFYKLASGFFTTILSSLILPIKDFMTIIMILATINIILGAIADSHWDFKKAFKAFVYLGGYILLLTLSVTAGKLMHLEEKEVVDFTSWITWVMIWFYTVNIFKNWNKAQPENKVIAFLYWVVSFKIVEKIKFLEEFNEKENENK